MMKSFLRNAKLATAAGFLILIALIWLVGPLAGVESREARLLAIVAVMLLLVIALISGRVLSERASGLLEKVLRRQTDEAVIGASAEQRRDVAQLRQRLLGAIDTLKTSRLGKVGGKAALYELPWYMIIGHPAAGKSSAILSSGLDFPFGDRQAVRGVGGTRNCDWFFTTEGVLLDTAGRYSTQREDRPEWLEFLKLLKKYRSKAPTNGIVVTISLPELIPHRSEQFAVYARQIRERINEIDDAFAIKVPIYLVFTKIDLLGGFAQFFEDFSEAERRAVWGATLMHDQGSAFDAARVVGQQFDALHRGLVQMGVDKIANNRGNVSRPALFAFPIEFHGLRDPVCKFVELLFAPDPYHSKPLLRGFYFTSALQEGNPLRTVGKRVASLFDLSQDGFESIQPPTSNSFFLRDLFREVIFADRHLITQQLKPASNRLRFAGMAAGLACLAVLAGALAWSFVGNQKLIASAREELAVARQLGESGELADRLKALQVLQLRLEQLYQYRRTRPPIMLGMGLYRGAEVEQSLRKEYFSGARELMLLPVKAALENTLTGMRDAAPPAPVPTPAPPHQQPKPALKPLPFIPIAHEMPSRHTARASAVAAVYRSDEAPVMLRTEVGGRAATGAVQAPRSTVAAVPPPARQPRTVASQPTGNRLEEGYNALKTYLMLKQRESMDAAHLSDQIPKYWRPWLTSNRGKSNAEEINRLAERVVAFYISQIGEDDLPLIENRADLIGQSRETLRSALRRLSAAERVYNELKARANTQFAPMTVGRILNSRDLDLVAGSSALAGAFTREAWDKYFRTAIADASKGEIRGDDWVLASSSLENLGKDGDAERNRRQLEELYKAEYTSEWKKFLQGVAMQEFGTLQNAAQALSRLADAETSPIRLILSKAAQETGWDNPSPLSKSIESAKNSVVERTEKLVLGASAAASAPPRLGEVGGRFAQLAALTAPGEGGRMPLSAYLDMLAKLKGRLAQIAAHAEPGGPARQLMQATLGASGSEFAEALALIDGVLLGNASDETRETVRPLLVRPLIQAYATLIPPVEQDVNRAWQAEVVGTWRTLADKYPFADSANETSMAEIAKFLRPGDGTLPRFVDKQLGGLVTRRGEQLLPRTWAGLGLAFSPAFLSAAARLLAAGNAVIQEGEGARFELQPVPTPGLSEIVVEVDGQILRYRNGPQPWTGFIWPNAPGTSAQGARLQVVSFAGVATAVANFNGRLGLMRLLAQARIDEQRGDTAQLEWRFKSPGGAAAPGDSEGDVVRFNFRLVSGANPLSMSELRRLGLPEKIVNRGS